MNIRFEDATIGILLKGLAKAEVTMGKINRKVNATIPIDTTDNSFILLFLIT
jgi:hypothetical protein